MLLVVAYDFWVTLIINNPLYGSIPSIKEVFMAKFNVLFNAAVKNSHAVLSHWVTKASLLALGIWCFPRDPMLIPVHQKLTTGSSRSLRSLGTG